MIPTAISIVLLDRYFDNKGTIGVGGRLQKIMLNKKENHQVILSYFRNGSLME